MLQMMLMGSLGNLNSYNSSGFFFIFQATMTSKVHIIKIHSIELTASGVFNGPMTL